MKKFTFAALAAVAAAAITSCGNGAPSANLKDDVDTLSYSIGMAQSDGLKDYLVQQVGIDTAYMDEFYKGLVDGATSSEDKKKAAYYAGIQIGQQVGGQMLKGINYEVFGEDSTQSVSLKNLLAGFIAGASGKDQKMNMAQARETFELKMAAIKKANMEKQFGDWKKENEKFLADNAKKEGIKVLPSGVQYKVLTPGNGAVPADTSIVKVEYEGKTIDGNVFDASANRGGAVEMQANRVIKGWTEALTHMPAGSEWEVYIPAALAYGESAQGQVIKPFSTLIFKIKLVEVKK